MAADAGPRRAAAGHRGRRRHRAGDRRRDAGERLAAPSAHRDRGDRIGARIGLDVGDGRPSRAAGRDGGHRRRPVGPRRDPARHRDPGREGPPGSAGSATASRTRPCPRRRWTARAAAPRAPFFPSSAGTNVGGTIPSNFFMTSQTCARCHEEIYKQWSSSAHHFSSFNNQWYRKSIEYMQDVVGTQPSKWCAGCHDHAVFFNGRFDRPIKEQINTPEAQAGLSCTSCHSIVHVKSTMGQGDFTIEYPPLHDLAASENPVLSRVHDYLLYTDPEPHRRDLHQELPPRADRAVLLVVPQGPPGRARERLPLVPRVQRIRQLAGLRRLRRRGAVVLLPGQAPEVRGLPHAAGGGQGPGRPGREDPLPPLPRRQHRAALRERRRRAAEDHAGLPARRAGLGGRLRPGPRRGGRDGG